MKYLDRMLTLTEDLLATVERLLALDAYTDAAQECYALATKLAALHGGKDAAALERSEEYAALASEFEAAKARADGHVESFVETDPERAE